MNLQTLKTATAQEVFDHVTRHLLTQGVRAQDHMDGRCMYRVLPNGFVIRSNQSNKPVLMCAAGSLIGDEEINEIANKYTQWTKVLHNDNSSSWNTADWYTLKQAGCVPDVHGQLIRDLQFVHDQTEPSQWMLELNAVALAHNLNNEVVRKMEKAPA